MTSRAQNERKFGNWCPLLHGGRLYWLEVPGKMNWRARYLKEVDANELTIRFRQEIYDNNGRLVEIHQKYPVDLGHMPVKESSE